MARPKLPHRTRQYMARLTDAERLRLNHIAAQAQISESKAIIQLINERYMEIMAAQTEVKE